jgi:hypothetical protein
MNNFHDDIFPLYSILNKIDDLIYEELLLVNSTLKRQDFEMIQQKMLSQIVHFIDYLTGKQPENMCAYANHMKC